VALVVKPRDMLLTLRFCRGRNRPYPRGKMAASRIFALGSRSAAQHYSADALAIFRGGGTSGIVGPPCFGCRYHIERPSVGTLAFAVFRPQELLASCAGDREIGRLISPKVPSKHRVVGVSLHPPVGDEFSVQQEIDIAFSRSRRNLIGAGHPLRGCVTYTTFSREG